MSDRDDIEELLHRRLVQCGYDPKTSAEWVANRVADDLASAGYRKVDLAAETRTEWAVHSHAHGSTERWKPCRDRRDAEEWAGSIAYWREPGAWKIRPHVVSRTATATAWTTPEEPR